jgi:hypothetical protein
MALIFELAAECGRDRSAAQMFGKHFDAQDWRLSDGFHSTWQFTELSVSPGDDGNYWCEITPSGLSKSGVRTELDARRMGEAGLLLYARLKTAPPFRFAVVGLEVLHFNTVDNLRNLANHPELNGFVVSSELWELWSRPPAFELFTRGYYWRPYRPPIAPEH